MYCLVERMIYQRRYNQTYFTKIQINFFEQQLENTECIKSIKKICQVKMLFMF